MTGSYRRQPPSSPTSIYHYYLFGMTDGTLHMCGETLLCRGYDYVIAEQRLQSLVVRSKRAFMLLASVLPLLRMSPYTGGQCVPLIGKNSQHAPLYWWSVLSNPPSPYTGAQCVP